jgi:hypothetical protein
MVMSLRSNRVSIQHAICAYYPGTTQTEEFLHCLELVNIVAQRLQFVDDARDPQGEILECIAVLEREILELLPQLLSARIIHNPYDMRTNFL